MTSIPEPVHVTVGKEVAVPKIAISRITSKGQITIPEVIQREYGLQAGEQVEWEVTDGGVLTVRKTGRSLEDLTRILPRPKRTLSIEEMDQTSMPAAPRTSRTT